MRKLGNSIAAAVSVFCVASVAGAAPPVAGFASPAPDGVLASVRIEFRAPGQAVISITSGRPGLVEPAQREETVVAWRFGEGRLRVTFDAGADRLEATLEDAAGATVVVFENAVGRGYAKLDPARFAPTVMGVLATTSNRGASGAIELAGAEIQTGRRPRPLQGLGSGTQSVSQLLHLEHALDRGFRFAGTIRFTGARPAAMSPLAVELHLLAEQVQPSADGGLEAPHNSEGVFTNSTPTTIAIVGTASPYPSQITVGPGQMSGVLTSIVVGFDNFDHTYPEEVAALLVGPSGSNVELMRAACGNFDLLDADFTFADAATLSMPAEAPCFSGSWKPTRYGPLVHFAPPAPPALYGLQLSDFLGESPIGTWSLFIDTHEDLGFPDIGRLDAWTLTLTTAIQIPSSGSVGNAAPYPSSYTTSGFDPTLGITGCGVYIDHVTHTYLGDLQLLFVAPSGQTSHLMGNACGGTNAVDLDWIFGDDPAVGFLPGSSCVTGVYRPTVVGAQAFPPPAPAGPYGRALAGVSGSGMNGVWALYALDDATGDVGRIRDWSFQCSSAPFWIFRDGFETGDLLLWSADLP